MKKILVIDDEEPIRLNIQMILQREGYTPILAKNGLEGIELAKKELPHLILCDVLMPTCDGFKVLETLRNHKPTSLIPFVFLTGKTEKDDFRKGMLMGGDDYIPKPFNIHELVKTVHAHLEKYSKFIEEAENMKWEGEESFRAIFKYAPVGIALISPDGKIVKVNTPYCVILGYTPDELHGTSIYDITYPADKENTRLMNEKLIWDELTHYTTEKRYLRKDGTIIWVNISVSGVYKRNKKLSYYISMIQDISERKNNEMESLKAERLLTIGKMAAMLTHEIKTPLTSIRMNVDLLTTSSCLTENNKKSLNIIKKETKRLTNLVKDVLQFSNQMDVVKNEFDLRKVFEDLAFTFGPIVRPININIVNQVEELNFFGDQEKLISAFSALVNNAIEAIGENGTIEFSSQFEPGEKLLRVFIKDSGCGIKDKDKIFDPFFTSKPSGTGLGLIIAQKIFQQHSGNISLKSSEPGKTIFEIIFSIKA